MKFAIAGSGDIAAIHAQAVHSRGEQVATVNEKYPDRSAAFPRRFKELLLKRCIQ